MRTVKIKGVKCEVTKSESTFSSKLEFADVRKRFAMFVEWHDIGTDEAKVRRKAVAVALGIVPADWQHGQNRFAMESPL